MDKMAGYLASLKACPPCGRDGGRDQPDATYGVYLFTETHDPTTASELPEPQDMYVGRVGMTERARQKGAGHSNFRTRLAGHTRPGSAHNQATFAFRLAVEGARGRFTDLPTDRAARGKHQGFAEIFAAQKARVNAMEFRWVEILDDLECYLFEPYAAYRLGTPYNSWATS